MVVRWDERNLAHLVARESWRNISPSEVDEVLRGPGSETRRLSGGRRSYRGRTAAGRFLAVIVDVLGPDQVRPRTAREVLP
jgi:hypothetical protein